MGMVVDELVILVDGSCSAMNTGVEISAHSLRKRLGDPERRGESSGFGGRDGTPGDLIASRFARIV